jgi:L-malate glycosyltransferase
MARIAFITTMAAAPWGGSEYLWAAGAEKALHDRHEVYISIYDWSISHPAIQNLVALGAKVLSRTRHPQPPSRSSRIIRKMTASLHLAKATNRSPYKDAFDLNPDVICISQGSTCDIGCFSDLVALTSSSNIPYIAICQHNTDISLQECSRKIIRDFFQHAHKVLFVSQHNLDLAKRQLASFLANAQVIGNPVNLAPTKNEPFPSTSTIKFASVARLDVFNKGQDLLFEALSAPQWKKRDWECNLYGIGDDLTYLKDLASLYAIQHKVKFHGHVNDVRKIWAENHILVLPSRAEGTPLSLVESMLCARPAVVTAIGGNAEWIAEAETGFIAAATTTQSFQSALERAWRDRGKWPEMGELAHKLATARIDKSPGDTLLKHLISAFSSQTSSKKLINV